MAAYQFCLEERRQPCPPLLACSISESAGKRGGLRLPALNAAAVRDELGRRIRSTLPPRPSAALSAQPRRIRGPDIGRAGAEVQKAAAVLGGLVLAGLGQLAQRLPRPPRRRNSLPFHQSFKLPWTARRAGSRRASRENCELSRALIVRGQQYERNLDVRAAVQCFEEASRLAPTCTDALALAAKNWSDLTFHYDVRTDKERALVNYKAIEYAEKCIEADPACAYGHTAICVSKGRLALFSDNKTKVRLAKEAQLAAHAALACDPDCDVAHHLMGRWHYEMSQINLVVRTLVRMVYGTALMPGTREDALASYLRASELAPQRLIHRVEAGRVLLELGQKQRAQEVLEEALVCEVDDINSYHTRMDGEKMLAQIKRLPYKQPSLVPPYAHQMPAGSPPPASMSTAALLNGHVEAHVIDGATAGDVPPVAA